MKTFIRGILTTVLVFTFTLIPTVIYTEKTVNQDLVGGYAKEALTDQLSVALHQGTTDLTEEQIKEIEDKLQKDESIKKIADKIGDRIIKDISKENVEDINLEEDIRNLLVENKDILGEAVGQEITEETIDQAIEEVSKEQDLNEQYKEIIEKTRNELPAESKIMIDSYNNMTSNEFIIILSVISVVAIIIIALLKKPYYKWIVNIGIAGIISAIFVALIGASISLVLNLVVESLEGTITISTTPMLITAVIMAIVSIILIVINNILDNHKENHRALS